MLIKELFTVRSLTLAGSLLLQLSALCFQSRGAAGDVDLSFDPGSAVNGTVNAVIVQPDGKVLIAGQFTTVKGFARTGVARLNADGSGDGSFDAGSVFSRPGQPAYVLGAVLQPDGKVLIGQDSGVTRLNTIGTMDGRFDFPFEAGATYGVTTTFALQPDGKMLLGGASVTETTDDDGAIHSSFSYSVQRVFANGSRDTNFNAAIRSTSFLAVQPDGKILYGTGSWIGRLNANGSMDTSFNFGPGLNGSIFVVALQPGGKVLVGGSFTINGTNRNGIARVNADGSMDTTFNPATGTIGVAALALQPDGKILIAGIFDYASTNRTPIARLNADGSLDSSFNPGAAVNDSVHSIALQSDGKVLVGGAFTIINGVRRNRLARLGADGSLDVSFHAGSIVPPVYSLALQPDGKTLVGGDFTSVQDLVRFGIARLNTNASVDGSFDPGTGDPSYISCVAMQPDGKMLIGGGFSSMDGTLSKQIARLNFDGSLDGGFGVNVGTTDSENYGAFVTSMAVQPDGKVLMGGTFTTINGTNRNSIARLHANGGLDASFNPGMFSYVRALVLQPDGKLLVGGTLTVNGAPKNGVFRLNANGGLDGSFSGALVVGYIASIKLQPDGKVIIGGAFSSVNGTSRTAIARLNINGALDGSFNSNIEAAPDGYAIVNSLAMQSDGKVLVGGLFSTVNGTNRSGLARLNADGSLDSRFNPGAGVAGGDYAVINSVVVQTDGNVLIAGVFNTVNGVVRPNIARLYGDLGPPPVSFAGWAAAFGLSGASAAADADPDFDGLPNGVEFVLGGDPTLPSAAKAPSVSLAAGSMILTFPRTDASEVSGIILSVESGTDLINWPQVFAIGSTTGTSSPGVNISENGSASDLITVAISLGNEQARFARLKVTVAP